VCPVGDTQVDGLVKAMSGVHQADYHQYEEERAILFSSMAFGCIAVISPGDPCYVKDASTAGDGKDKVTCGAYVLSVQDLCWYHTSKADRKYLSNPNIVNRDRLATFLSEYENTIPTDTDDHTTTSNRFFGAPLSKVLITRMQTELARRDGKVEVPVIEYHLPPPAVTDNLRLIHGSSQYFPVMFAVYTYVRCIYICQTCRLYTCVGITTAEWPSRACGHWCGPGRNRRRCGWNRC
jgi:hypothetical protein